ncbi:alpha/beta fold hydrolase [Cellulomonas sp. McL0617]|uniref:alpha/beta fold hydrolase n=1 Tax=Cellulomonas sp. McL0617 TaxID=3415675 RepID=UPI003CEB37B3
MPARTTRTARVVVRTVATSLLLVLAAAFTMGSASAHRPEAPKPTIVLVHGAFADASSWSEVTQRLQRKGYTVYAPANPLRGIAPDADYLRSFLATIPGPIVLVGHSYGGAVITNAATGLPNVRSLVYVAAYALDEGESIGAANALGGGTALLGQHIVVRPTTGAAPGDVDAYIDPAYFRDVFAADLPAAQAQTMAAGQRPLLASALGTPSGVPAWKTIPSWYVVATKDHAIPPEAERAMAARAGSRTTELNASHVVMLSRPDAVVQVILDAAGR